MKKEGKKLNLLFIAIISIFFICLFNLSSFATSYLPGDFVGPMGDPTPDGKVDFNDLMVFATAYGSETGDPNWNDICDICGYLGDPDPDGQVNFDDLMVFATNYGKEIEIIIPDTTKIADEETELQLTFVSQDQSEITFVQSTPQLEELQEGDILFIGVTDQTPYGLLRKVTTITRGTKADDTLTVSTEFTSIEEAVEELHVSVDIVLTQDDIDYEKLCLPPGVSMSQDRGGFEYEHTFNLSDVSPIYVGDPSTTIDDVTIDGEINLNYEMIFNLDIGWFNLDVEFRNIVESYTDLNVSVGGSLSLSDLLDPNPIHLFTIPFVPIPVAPLLVITPVIYINIGLDGEIHAELTVGVTIDQTGDNRLESGFEYDNGTWHSIKNSPVFDLEPKIPVLNLGGTIKPYLGPQLELIFNGCAGVYGSLYGYLELQADINDDPWWCLYGGFEGIIGAQLKILSFDLGDPVEWTIFNPDSKLLCCADGPFIDINHPPIISSLTADPPSIDINQTTSITCTASDEDVGDTLTYTWTKNGGTFEGSSAEPTITWRAPSTQGNYTITCEVSDGEASDSGQVVITVNDPGTSYSVHNLTKDTYYTTIQAALDDADSGDTIEVDDGTYYEGGIIFPSNKKVILQSKSGADNTIINGSGINDSVIIIDNVLEGSVIKGFTITKGSGHNYPLGGNPNYPPCGGGIFILNDSVLDILNCIIEDNSAKRGGGICVYSNSSIKLTNCNIVNNYGEYGGGVRVSDGSSILTDCDISNNSSSFGGGIYEYDVFLEINNCTINNNSALSGGGIMCGGSYFGDDNIVTLTDCILDSNVAIHSGAIQINYHSGLLELINCTISNNSSNGGYGALGIYLESSLNIRNSTISSNEDSYAGGGIYLFQTDDCQIINNQIIYNSTDEIGGGIYVENPIGTITITDNTLCGNTCGGIATDENQIYPNDYPNNDISATCNGTYALRDTGPGKGGLIFYDKGSYSIGWRYLEAAPVSTEWMDK